MTWLTSWVRWPVHSQRAARRNAQEAATSLAQERRAREQVDSEVDRLIESRSSSTEREPQG